MNAALHLEFLKFLRATPVRAATVVMVILVPALSAAFLALARADSNGTLALKIAPLLQDDGWGGLTGFSAQIFSVGGLLAIGVVVSWVFGREFTEKAFGSLFATAVPRESIAAAKLVILLAWGTLVSVATALATLLAGLIIGLGAPESHAWGAVGRIIVVGILTTALCLPLAVVASAARGYLAAISALLAIVVITQVTVALGAGAWFPYAATGLWAGLGGAVLSAEVEAPQLLLAVPIGMVAAFGTWLWWRRAFVQ
ncbi:ABC transporter permease [Microbacterium sp. A93]|uniref:ABC transporter permease n=1 Tax=unclassified Microbacterium TaxID=2609290 RepID=UPI003F4226CD